MDLPFLLSMSMTYLTYTKLHECFADDTKIYHPINPSYDYTVSAVMFGCHAWISPGVAKYISFGHTTVKLETLAKKNFGESWSKEFWRNKRRNADIEKPSIIIMFKLNSDGAEN